jgi:hypothetical protein
MAIYNRPSDLQTGNEESVHVGGGMSPSLEEQTPGLEPTSRVRNLAMRPVAWVRERPDIAIAIFGGLAAVGLGTWLALRNRRVSRIDQIKSRAEDMVGWLRSRV